MAKKKSSRTTSGKQTKKSGKTGARKSTGSRELIDTGSDKRYVRRDSEGRFKESDDVGRSLAQDRKRKAKTAAKRGQGDRGDRKSR